MRRALAFTVVLFACLVPLPSAQGATTQTITITNGSPNPNPANIAAGDKVKWHSNDVAYKINAEGSTIDVPAGGDSGQQGPFDTGTYDYTVKDALNTTTVGSGQIVAEEPTTTTSEPTSTTVSSTTTTTTSSSSSGSTTSSTSSTTTTSSSTTTTTTTTPRAFSSASGQIPIKDTGGKSGSSSALPILLGAFILVAGLAGLAYWLWLRSGEPYEDDGPDWTQEPPTVQGPRI